MSDTGAPAARRQEEVDAEDDGQDAPVAWRRLAGFSWRLLRRHPLLLTGSVLAAFGVALADMASLALLLPFVASLGGTSAIPEGFAFAFLLEPFAHLSIEEKVRTIAVLLVVIQLVRGGLSYAESRMTQYLALLFERDLRQLVFDDLLRVELRFIHKQKTSDLFTLMHTFPKESSRLVRDYLGGMSRIITGAMLVATLFAVSWELTLVALALGGLSLLVVSRLRGVVKRLGRDMNQSRRRLHQASLESLQSMRVIRLFAREDHARRRFMGEVVELQRQAYRSASLQALSAPIQRLVNITLFAGLLIAATIVMDATGASWLLLLTVFLMIVARLMGPLSNFASRSARIAAETPAFESVVTYLERADKPYLREGPQSFDRLREGIRFEGVGFSYGPDQAPVLQDVTFDIPRGSMVALVGESGSGKSTLVQLLSRLSDPTEGRIVVDGRDLREYRSASWRGRVAVVSQDTHLFNDTVRNNIRFGRLDATDLEVEQAARLADAHAFILQMEQGYDTRVGERGVRLSGGQAQRIAIARAILADPEVLVLDEATSALDTATERAVQEAIDTVCRDRTVVAIAHRLSTVRHADLILVMEKGRIVERGTHDELVRLGGRYANLVRLQDVSGDGAPTRSVRVPVTAPDAAGAAARAPARPTAVVLAAQSRDALVRFDDGRERRVPLLVVAPGAATAAGEHVAVRAGEGAAVVHVDGHAHGGVPMFHKDATGAEKRVRVREARGSGAPRVRMA